MQRDVAVDLLSAVVEVEKLLDPCPHGAAVKILQALKVVVDHANEAFPGGYCGECGSCGRHIGEEECAAREDEICCRSCLSERLAEMQACAHAGMIDDTDEHGDPGKFCPRCGFFAPTEAAQPAA